MVDFLTLVQNTFRKLQLKVEIVILDRDITNRQRKFGIELYDLIEKQRRALHTQLEKDYGTTDDDDNDDDKLKKAIAVDDITQTLKLFQIIENEIKIPLEVTRKEINNMRESSVKFPPLLIQRRKEDFGRTIWPIICEETLWTHETLEKDLLLKNKDAANANANANNDNTTIVSNFMNVAIKAIEKGTKSTLKKVVGKLSLEEREVEACVDKAKSDIKVIENQKLEKQDEINSLLNDNTTIECSC
ncbi:hypothetical protein FRACYDRAFT_249096 [Fragilariopsis cylindrus CCMP1102]|uniref:Uncharacterized protein n=1 Tax=Fragilariopsis cylindrus CCMP1102 TaxID=635003 RepID=A0A1E7ETL5_9STRA|nr:hypothetical protein FRACYDRAFT_249096 [Fragilariopsis cylindrus CCMP1102]|eukprot:OEU09177.1 hypothetical protein FRACYDRAFT_249096 [Fragilariopsis cylindrus CCMP1102]